MKNRTAAWIITIIAALLFLFPGLGFLCCGLTSMLYPLAGYGYIFGDQSANQWVVFGFFCSGVILILIAVIICVLVLWKREDKPSSPEEPIPPTM